MGLGAILDHGKAPGFRQRKQRVHIAWLAEDVNGDNGFGSRERAPFTDLESKVNETGSMSANTGLGAENRDGGRRGDERKRRHDHFIAWTHARGFERELERGGPGIYAEAELGAHGLRELDVERPVFRTQDEDARVEHARDGGLHFGADLGLLALQGEKRNVHGDRGQ